MAFPFADGTVSQPHARTDPCIIILYAYDYEADPCTLLNWANGGKCNGCTSELAS